MNAALPSETASAIMVPVYLSTFELAKRAKKNRNVAIRLLASGVLRPSALLDSGGKIPRPLFTANDVEIVTENSR